MMRAAQELKYFHFWARWRAPGIHGPRSPARALRLADSGEASRGSFFLMHFVIGSAVVVVLGAAAWLSRILPENDLARRIHPLLGMLAALLASLQVFLGLPLLTL